MNSESKKDTVLIVEDSGVQAKIIRNHIETLTLFATETAASLQEAEEKLADISDRIFIAIADLNLPDAPEGEVVDLLLSKKIPSMVLTATYDEKVRARILGQNVVDFFIKGSVADMDPMVSAIERVHKNLSVTVLLVDDSKSHRNMISRMLETQCFSVVTATDGVEALEILAANPDIRLVITDNEMPRMGGIALTKEIRAKFLPKEVAIIGVSGIGTGMVTAQFLKNGANDFLKKPFEAEEFYWRVNQTMENQDMLIRLDGFLKGQKES